MMEITRRQVLKGTAMALVLPSVILPALAREETFDVSLSLTSVVLDLSVDSYFDVVLDSDVSFLFLVNATPGQTVSVAIRQDAVGGRKFDWQDDVTWEHSHLPMPTVRSGGIDMAWEHSHLPTPTVRPDGIDVYWLTTPDGENWFGWMAADMV